MGKSSAKDSIRELDMFGHNVMFNFNRKGPSHNTVCGGIISLMIKIFILGYAILNIKKLIFYEDDKYTSVTWATPNIKLGEVDYSKTNTFAIELL